MVDELLHYLSESHPECLPPSKKVTDFAAPLNPSSSYKETVELTAASLELQSSKEVEKIKETQQIARSLLSLFVCTERTFLAGNLFHCFQRGMIQSISLIE